MQKLQTTSFSSLLLLLLLISSLPPTTSVTAAVLPCPHLFGEAVCSNKPQAPSLPHPRRLLQRSVHTCCHHPSSFYLVFYHAGSDVVGFGPLCQSRGSSIAACRHRAHIDQSGRLMVIAGSVGLNQRPHLLRERGRRSSSGKYALHSLPLVLEGTADKTHIKNQFLH